MSATSFVMPNDLSDLCRVCLQLPEESQYLDLSTIYDEDDNLTYGECFTICTHIDLNAGEGVPHHLCKSCGLELQMSYDFHKKIEESKRVIEQCQKQIYEQKTNVVGVVDSIEQPNNVNCDALEEMDIVQLINNKYEISDDEELAETSQEMEDMCGIRLENEQHFETQPDENDETDEIDIINRICQIEANTQQEVPPDKDCNTSMKPLNDHDVEGDGEEMEDYQNLEALEDEDLPFYMLKDECTNNKITTEEEIITNTTITPCIPAGIRLPLPPGPPFICEFCGHNSNTKSLLASHRHRKHRLKESAYQCDKCEKQFNTKDAYDKHVQRLSCQQYPEFTCEYCSKKIKGSANYKIHLRFHKKIYPFECEKCGKGFMLAVHLKTHIQTKHENKRFVCEELYCGKLFQSLQSLKSHMYVHLGSMPYCCEYCEKMFPNRGSLRWHIKRTHDTDVSQEDLDRMLVSEEISIKATVQPVEFESDTENY